MPEMNFKLINADNFPRTLLADGVAANLTTILNGSPDVVTTYNTTIANGEAVFADAGWAVGEVKKCVLTSGGLTQLVDSTVTIADQLANGHYVASQFPMELISPRPDADTGSYAGTVNARHRWAYYDGVNKVRYEATVKVFGGSPPHRYRIVSGPVDASIGKVFDGNGLSHSILKWVPDKAYSTGNPATFVVRVTDQEGATIDITWTVATSVSKFVFLANSGNDSSGDGTINLPFASLPKVMGSASTVTTYPDKLVYMRGGSYATAAHSDFTAALVLKVGKHPLTYMSYPDEVVSVNFAAAEIAMDDNANDVWFGGSSGSQLRIIGSSNGAAETHNIWLGSNSKRITFMFVDFDGFVPRVAGGFTNSVPIFAPGSNSNPTRQYLTMHRVREINRTATSNNDGLVCILFGVKWVAMEYCSGTRTVGPGVSFKDTCFKTSTRYCDFRTNNEEFGFAWMCQNGSGEQELCFSRIEGRVRFNLQGAASNLVLKHVEYRNNIYVHDANYTAALLSWPGTGPLLSINSLITSPALPAVDSNITASGTEGHTLYTSSNHPFNYTTLNLENVGGGTAWRTLYLGTRGAEIL